MFSGNIDKTTTSVSEYIAILNGVLDDVAGEIIGEITEFQKSAKGHVYFSLKDEKTNDILPCMVWGYDYLLNGFEFENGMKILVKGKPNFYGPFGKLSFNVKIAELVGEGALKKTYDKLKLKLSKEGLFAEERKGPIPLYPEKIGVITSKTGAVIHDFTNNLGKHGFKVKIMDTRVEGQEAGRDLILSVRAFMKEDIDVLVLIRGGGSMQSLAGFDNETLVREIANFPVPVIAGIGHHQDDPLVALVADKAVSTPSIVAGLLNNSWQEAKILLTNSQRTVLDTFEKRARDTRNQLVETFNTAKAIFENIFRTYNDAKNIVKENLIKIKYSLLSLKKNTDAQIKYILRRYSLSIRDIKTKTILVIIKNILDHCEFKIIRSRNKFDDFKYIIEVNNPKRQLKLGYSLVRCNGRLIKNANNLKIGDDIETQFFEGKVRSQVKNLI